MFSNYFKTALRNLLKNPFFSFINVFGLAVGLATCLLIALYSFDELSYDSHHREGNRVFRIAIFSSKGNPWAGNSAPVAWAAKNDFPEVEQVARLLKFPTLDNVMIKYEEGENSKQFFEPGGFYVDSTFFQLFDYHFLHGDAGTALNLPNTIVISSSISKKLFGSSNPINKSINIGMPFGNFDYTIKGVFDDSNIKSHIPSTIFLSMKNNDVGTWAEKQTNWATNNIFYTYVKLKKGTDPQTFEKKLQPFLDSRGGADVKASGGTKSFFIQPLKDIYLHSSIDGEIAANGNIKYLYILGTIATILLIVACINFMNLSTARSERRAREVGVRKVLGAGKSSLIWQFLGESVLMSIIALVLAMIIASLFLNIFNSLTQKNLDLFHNPSFLFFIVGLTILTGVIAGIYPAFYLSSFKPALVIKGKIANNFSAETIRKGLVVFQFAVSVCLILSAVVISRQLHFVQNEHLGFNKERQLVLPVRSPEVGKNYEALKNELLKDPDILSVTSCSAYPGIPVINDMLFYGEGKNIKDNVDIHMATVEHDFFETLGFKILYGRGFSKEFTGDSSAIVLNETAVKALGYTPSTAIGKKAFYEWENRKLNVEIVGVVQNFHYESLHNEIRPFGFSYNDFFANRRNFFIANISSDNYTAVLTRIENTWSDINKSTPFNYSFIDQDFQKNYDKEKRTSSIVLSFTGIAILIACLGLFGLAVFSAERRMKEIGIRKILGAGESTIVAMLSRDFLKLIPISFALSFPIGWWVMQRWLDNFVYRIQISWWMFLIAGGAAIFIAFLTISYQSIRAAVSNPLKSLRTE